MAISDFTGKNIQDTYQRVVQTDGTNLADGTGSLLPISFEGNNVIISGSLTATEYSVSSSVTNIVIATKSGSTAFGDSIDDIHQFTGSVNVSGSLNFTDGDISVRHITASGNISASGNITGNSYQIQGKSGITYNDANSRIIYGQNNQNSRLRGATITLGDDATQHVTASGNISASGRVYGTHFGTGNANANAIDFSTNNTVQFRLNNASRTTHTTTQFRPTTDEAVSLGRAANKWKELVVNHITASGNISASGTITADTLTSNNIVFTPGATSIKIEAPDETSGNVAGADLTIEAGNGFGSNANGGNITLQTGKGMGSGDGGNLILQPGGGGAISQPSGSISFNSPLINVNGNITSSGNISSSGTITANTFIVPFGSSIIGEDSSGNTNDILITNAADSFGVSFGDSDHSTTLGGGAITLDSGLDIHLNADGGDVTFADGTGGTKVNINTTAGHITASGNISSSGTLIANSAYVDSLNHKDGLDTQISFNTDQIRLNAGGVINTNWYTYGTQFLLPITASGNISSSGNIITTKAIVRDGSGGGIIFDDDGDEIAEASITHTGGGINLYANGSNPTSATHLFVTQSGGTGMAHGKVGIGTMTPDEQLEVVGNISASGNVHSKYGHFGAGIHNQIDERYLHVHSDGSAYLRLTSPGNQNQVIEFHNNQEPDFSIGNYFNDGGLQIRSDNKAFAIFGANDGDVITLSGSISASGIVSASQFIASGDISASGQLHTKALLFTNGQRSLYNSSGQLFVGDGVGAVTVPQLKVNSHITASGNISSSGTIKANIFEVSEGHRLADFNGGAIAIGRENNTTIMFGKSANSFNFIGGGAITASGDISASGNLIAAGVRLPGNGIISFDDSLNGTDQFIKGVDNQLSIDGDNFVKVFSDKFTTFYNSSAEDHFTIQHESGSIVTDYSISSSGNISASGDIISNNIISNTLDVDTRKIEVSSGTDGNYKGGDVVFFGNTTSMELGKIYHLKSDSTWELADADDNTKSDGLLGVALGAASNTNGVLLRGMVTLDHDPGAIGDPLYLTTTEGIASATAPSGNNNIVRIIGYCLHPSAGNIWFNPDSTFVEVSA